MPTKKQLPAKQKSNSPFEIIERPDSEEFEIIERPTPPKSILKKTKKKSSKEKSSKKTKKIRFKSPEKRTYKISPGHCLRKPTTLTKEEKKERIAKYKKLAKNYMKTFCKREHIENIIRTRPQPHPKHENTGKSVGQHTLDQMKKIGIKSFIIQSIIERNEKVDRKEQDWKLNKGRAIAND